MSVKISQIAYYLPETIVSNEEIEIQSTQLTAAKIEAKVGVARRHVAGAGETALDMAYQACLKLFQDYDKSQVDFIILCTQSPDYIMPTSACVLQHKLGLSMGVGAFDFNLGCSGFIYGLGIAKGLIATGQASNVLLVTSETYSKHIHPRDFANRTIFGDGAAATIVSKSETEGVLQSSYGTNGSEDDIIVPNGAQRHSREENCEDREYTPGNFTNDNCFYMNGPEVFNFTIEKVPLLLNDVLAKNDIELHDIDYFIFHQANKYMLEYLRKKTRIPENKFYINMLETGNTVSSTIPIALHDCKQRDLIKKNDKVLLCAFGVGYSWAATVIII